MHRIALVLGSAWLLGCGYEHFGLTPGPGSADASLIDAPEPADGAPDGTPVPDGPPIPDGPPTPDVPGSPDAEPPDAEPPDASPPDAYVCVPWTWTPANFNPCDPLLPAPTESLDLPDALDWEGYFYDTDTGLLHWPDGVTITSPPSAILPQGAGEPDIRVMNLSSLSMGDFVYFFSVGTYPLVIAVHGSATLDFGSYIDVSGFYFVDSMTGDRTSVAGPGGDDPTACAGSFGEIGENSTGAGGAGGGGGGGYGGNGGDGGDGNGTNAGGKGAKGGNSGNANITPLRGGCGGDDGGNPNGVTGQGGWLGHGGGAFELAVRDSLTADGVIIAAGEEGKAPTAFQGGGGGAGSGGAILLEADVLVVGAAAAICANGGSGGEGDGGASDGADGEPGSCSETVRATTPNNTTNGGNGGAGGYAGGSNAENAGNGAGGVGGGGGGGGGVGRIRFRGITTETVPASATVSPAAAP